MHKLPIYFILFHFLILRVVVVVVVVLVVLVVVVVVVVVVLFPSSQHDLCHYKNQKKQFITYDQGFHMISSSLLMIKHLLRILAVPNSSVFL